MAIFAGEFLDDAGKPWDPEAKVVHKRAAGGTVAVRRHAINPHPSHAPFVAAARYMAARWHNALDAADQADWDTQGVTGATRRGSPSRTPVGGYVQLNAYDFIQLWADPPSAVTGSGVALPVEFAVSIDTVTLAAQTVTFTAVAGFEIPLCTLTRLATFQINPRAVLFSNPWRATRLIDLADAGDLDPGPYNPTVPLAWPVQAGDTVRLYWRARVRSWWTYEDDESIVA